MTYRFICIDDGKPREIEPLLKTLQDRSKGKITIERKRPAPFEDLVVTIRQADPDGLILDLRLDEEADPEGHRARYRGTTLAQDLRTRMSEGDIRSIPIALWSIDWKLKNSFLRDDTVQDLFDQVYDKEMEVGATRRPRQT